MSREMSPCASSRRSPSRAPAPTGSRSCCPRSTASNGRRDYCSGSRGTHTRAKSGRRNPAAARPIRCIDPTRCRTPTTAACTRRGVPATPGSSLQLDEGLHPRTEPAQRRDRSRWSTIGPSECCRSKPSRRPSTAAGPGTGCCCRFAATAGRDGPRPRRSARQSEPLRQAPRRHSGRPA